MNRPPRNAGIALDPRVVQELARAVVSASEGSITIAAHLANLSPFDFRQLVLGETLILSDGTLREKLGRAVLAAGEMAANYSPDAVRNWRRHVALASQLADGQEVIS